MYPNIARMIEMKRNETRLVLMLSFIFLKAELPKALLVTTEAPMPPPIATAMKTEVRE